MADSPLISFVIPVRNDAQRLRRCLESIRADDYPQQDVEVVVVDNGSRDSSPDVARGLNANVLIVPGRRVGELRNLGAKSARGQFLAFVDADHELGPGSIRAAVEDLECPDVGAVGAPCHAPPDGSWVQRAYDRLRRHTPGLNDVQWLGSGNLVVRRHVFQSLQGFDPRLETCEDVDLCKRLRLQGHRLVSDGRLRNIHFGDPATLRQVLTGEMWRGRDNLRVTLRPPVSAWDFPSVAIPALYLLCLVIAVVGALSWSHWGLLAVVSAGILLALLATLRTVRMALNSGVADLAGLASSFAVAVTYDLGRSLALVLRRRHHRATQEPRR